MMGGLLIFAMSVGVAVEYTSPVLIKVGLVLFFMDVL